MNTLTSVRVKLSSKKLREKISKITPFRAGIAKKDCGKISKITLKSANVTHVTSADFQSKSRKKIARKISKMTSKSADVTRVTSADVNQIFQKKLAVLKLKISPKFCHIWRKKKHLAILKMSLWQPAILDTLQFQSKTPRHGWVSQQWLPSWNQRLKVSPPEPTNNLWGVAPATK